MSFSPASPGGSDSVCYRHPNRASFTLCQRCGRTICGECQTPAAVGVICPECMAAQRAAASPAQRRASRGAGSGVLARVTRPGFPTVTLGIIVVTAIVFIFQFIPGLGVTGLLQYAGIYSYPAWLPLDNPYGFQPWRMLTSVFTHSTGFILHIALNMYTLWIFGQALEAMLGRGRFLTLYLVSGFAGSLGVLYLAAPGQAVVGASGAIFGLMGAFIVIQRKLGVQMRSLLVLVAINLVIGFVPGFSISWQAHLGGLVGGAIVGLIYYSNRHSNRSGRLWWEIAALIAVFVALSLVRFQLLPL